MKYFTKNNNLMSRDNNFFILLIGHLFFLIYFIFSIIFFKERLLFVDSSYQFFKIINYEEFNIEAGRISTIITQIPLYLALNTNMPVYYLALLFSISFPILFYLIYLIISHYYKLPSIGLVLCITLCLCIRHSYFHTVTETHQALVYSCLFFAWIFSDRNKNVVSVLEGLTILFLACFSHPIAFITCSYILFYYLIDSKFTFNKYFNISLLVLISLVVLKIIITPKNGYEGNFFNQILLFPEIIKNYNSLYTRWFYGHFYCSFYQISFWIVVLSVMYYLFYQKYIKLIYVGLSYYAFLVFTHLLYHAGDSQVMLERSYMPLAFFSSICISFDLYKNSDKLQIVSSIFIIAILVYSLSNIYETSKYFTNRVSYMKQLFNINESKYDKFIVKWENISNELINVPWAFGVETLLFSSIEGYQQQKTVYIRLPDQDLPALDNENLFLFVHFNKKEDINMLNKKYFNLTKSNYFFSDEKIIFNHN